MTLDGIHHISAMTGDARGNLDFYTRVLGLRLVAKTVNQDDPGVYHLFYADERGTPGAELTFFEYPGLPRGRAGQGMVHRIVSAVGSEAALDFWQERLGDEGVGVERPSAQALRFADPEGLGHELVVTTRDRPLRAEHPEIPAEHAVSGFVGVRAYSAAPERSGELLEGILGAERAGDDTWELRRDGRGAAIAFDAPPDERRLAGAGTVHHVAWATTKEEHPLWQERLVEAGVRVTEVIDRYYFHAMYFREPSGVLYEIADNGPGFTRDMPVEELGSRVILPAWLEGQRAEVEGRLTPLPDPRAGWSVRS
jgi:glyoxalase family protein